MKPSPFFADITAQVSGEDEVHEDAGSVPSMHRRSPSGTAVCGTPAKQEQMTDGMEFDCPRCWGMHTGLARG